MDIHSAQMNEIGKPFKDNFILRLADFLRRKAPNLTSHFDQHQLHQYCVDCTEFALNHEVDEQNLIVQMSIYFLDMKVNFRSQNPPVWVTKPREDGEFDSNEDWVKYIFNGSKVDLSTDAKV